MPSRTVAEIRQRIAARVLASPAVPGEAAADPPLVEAAEPYEWFLDAAKRSPRHCAFCVGVPKTEEQGANRQKPSEGTYSITELHVLVTYQLRPTERVASFDEALAVEAVIRNRLVAQDADWPKDFSVRWSRSERSALGPDGWLVIRNIFGILHLLPLE